MQTRIEESNVFGYLRELGLLTPGERATLSPAGDGNVNWVRRVRRAGGGSFVLKQARPTLERFPEYRAPTERILCEARYCEDARRFDPERVLPRVLHFDPEQRVLVLEDLGDAERLDCSLARGDGATVALQRLARFLARVHAGTRGDEDRLARRYPNQAMQRLHGDHIFDLPFRENDFPLSPALRARARAIWCDASLRECIDAAHARYREPRGALVHADVQSGNVLLAERGPVLLDAEIAHVGDPAFDVGMLLAHVALPAIARGDAEAANPLAGAVWSAYAEEHGADALAAYADAARYAGIELLRRTLGAARVEAVSEDRAGLAVLEAGLAWVREPPTRPR